MIQNRRKNLTGILLCLCVVLMILPAGCGKKSEKTMVDRTFSPPADRSSISSGIIAENQLLQMQWDDYRKCLFLIDKKTEKIWGTTPYRFYTDPAEEGLGKVRMESPLIIDYIEPDGSGTKNVLGSLGILENGKAVAEKINDGIKVTYYFTPLEISIPVKYTLYNDYIEISLDIENIKENENKLYQVTIAPFFASCENREDSYLFLPSGSGAVMYCDAGKRSPREASVEMYGADAAVTVDMNSVNERAARLPVFGVKDGGDALCGIITEGSELSVLDAQAGNDRIGYSSVAPAFKLRSSDTVRISYVGKEQVISQKFSDEIAYIKTASVRYYSLGGNSAGYMGMADIYRNYLTAEQGLLRSDSEKGLYLEFLGGTLGKEFVFGIPHTKTIAATTYSDIQNILEKLNDLGDETVVRLNGFTDSGLDPGMAGGGFVPSKLMGSKSEFDKLSRYCKDASIPFAFDLDLINFRKSGGGFSISGDVARTASNVAAKKPVFSVALKSPDENHYTYRLLSRQALGRALDKALNSMKKWDINGIGLTSLSSVAYSDNRYSEYVSKGSMPQQTAELFKHAKDKENALTIMASDANAYAAVNADYIWDVPVASNQNDAFDKDIPFYQIVFKGYRPIGGPSVNLAVSPVKMWLNSIRGASGLTFSLCGRYCPEFLLSAQSALQASVYEDVEPMIIDLTNRSMGYFKAVSGLTIIDYREISPGICLTVFDNNSRVYTNYTAVDYDSPDGVVTGYDYRYVS